ncbi:hypothetical protein, conserved [Eimeria tenella]|uniref:Uncharacterized protein n=1 Tax=Eimeria tenella TaxID=5802 RepID=F1DQG2_EIMTE|nr:hypothetical protein, conserved [Eimeria tenella]ADX36370.1 hypothetical protein [Eimeria tenella]CDJ42402.1 hypothetical protein, conserved [Eimeria tenella]|eukprot:XP_013233152.1 hypothetical protein, conserved [Eimeria tenella]
MDQPQGSLRGAQAGSSSGEGTRVEKRVEAGSEQFSENGNPREAEVHEEVAEPPKLPDEPCFGRPKPHPFGVKQLITSFGAAISALGLMVQGLGSAGDKRLGQPSAPVLPPAPSPLDLEHAGVEPVPDLTAQDAQRKPHLLEPVPESPDPDEVSEDPLMPGM